MPKTPMYIIIPGRGSRPFCKGLNIWLARTRQIKDWAELLTAYIYTTPRCPPIRKDEEGKRVVKYVQAISMDSATVNSYILCISGSIPFENTAMTKKKGPPSGRISSCRRRKLY